MTNCCIRVAGSSNFINFVHSSGEYSAILAATRHGGETLCDTFDQLVNNHEMKYIVKLDNAEIGKSELEFGDPPMGIVFGKLHLPEIKSGFDFLKNYCAKNKIEFTAYPEDKLITTFNIPDLKVFNQSGKEILGESSISGMDSDSFDITIMGITYPFYEEEFPEHVKRYNEMF